MSSINSVSLIGRLTQDPAVTPSTETTRCKMRIAVQRRRGKDGEDKGANYFDVVAFGGQAVNCGKYLRKGRQIALTGHLNHSEWTAEDGSSRQRVEIIADNVMFLDAPKRDEAEDQETAVAAGVGTEDDTAF
jgi:single-strand DNA-binding protein